jgi:hypothetical protein
VFAAKPEANTSLRKPQDRWGENITISVKETECLSVRWIHLAQNREKWQDFVINVLILQVP